MTLSSLLSPSLVRLGTVPSRLDQSSPAAGIACRLAASGGLLALLFAGVTTSALAGAIPYANVGTIAPEVSVFASGDGGINVFYFGSGANFYDSVEVLDPTTGYDSGPILGNHATVLGAELTLGTGAGGIKAGDQLVFFIDSPEGKFASLDSYSADGVNHAYLTNYAGGTVGGVSVPSGLYVGLEDQTNGFADFDYDDDSFVFTGVTAPSMPVAATPEPSTLALLGTGLLGAAGAVRRRLTDR